jgi:DNA polymerase III alpha subunit
MRALGAQGSAAANQAPDGSRIRVAGLVITRQAPSTAGKIRFFTLEDEHGHVNVIIKPDVYQRFRREAAQPILVIDGVVQSHDGVWSLLAIVITPLPHGHSESTHSHDYR